MKKRIVILGSTGSIGTQALEVIEAHRDKFDLVGIAAGKNADLLIEQALKFQPAYVVIGDEHKYRDVADALKFLPVQVSAGLDALCTVSALPDIEIVLTALVGYAGLKPTIGAIKAGKNIALANKETLVVAGELIKSGAASSGSSIYPVDSEHSAIFQCLVGESAGSIEKIYLTASGGPFRGKSHAELRHVTRREALQHPNWCMGEKVTIDSATLMNKGLEAIEARWLFDLNPDQIDVVIHPQSVIHSVVQFIDGSMKAQMGLPDMRLPIQYALSYPERIQSGFKRFSFTDYPSFTFEKPDTLVFRSLELAFTALRKGGNLPCIMNAANEVVVEAFLQDRIDFLKIPEIIESAMVKMDFVAHPSFDDYSECDCDTRIYTRELIGL